MDITSLVNFSSSLSDSAMERLISVYGDEFNSSQWRQIPKDTLSSFYPQIKNLNAVLYCLYFENNITLFEDGNTVVLRVN